MYGYSSGVQRQPEEESVYNLISKPQAQMARATMHRSRYPPDTPPTGSTFRRTSTSQVAVSNLAGEYSSTIPVKTSHAMFGPRASSAPDTTNFLRKHEGVVTRRGFGITGMSPFLSIYFHTILFIIDSTLSSYPMGSLLL